MRDPRELETEHTLRFMRQVLPPPGARVLEVGCGEGAPAGGDEMLQSARRRFQVSEVQRTAYLYGYFCDALPPAEDSFAAAARIYAEEQELLLQGKLRPVGMRWTGIRA